MGGSWESESERGSKGEKRECGDNAYIHCSCTRNVPKQHIFTISALFLNFLPLQLNQKSHYVHLLQEILVSRQQLLQSALFEGSLDKLPFPSLAPPTGASNSGGGQYLKAKANKKYRKWVTVAIVSCKYTTLIHLHM